MPDGTVNRQADILLWQMQRHTLPGLLLIHITPADAFAEQGGVAEN